MSHVSLSCPACAADMTVAVRRLLVRVDQGEGRSGELLYTCLMCGSTVATALDGASVAALVSAGVSYLAMSEPSEPGVEQPGPHPGADGLP